MKIFDILKKKPAAEASKEKKVKNVLLQTYFTSLLSLVLCVGMFFGTSYAWFTSEVENKGNEIYIGTLDVELEKQVADGDDEDTAPDYVSLSAKNSEGVNTNKLFDSSIRWEPGYTAIETIQIVNEGDLAFKYVLNFTEGKLTFKDADDAEKTLGDVAKYFEVRVYKHKDAADVLDFTKINYASLGEKWSEAVDLDKLLSGEAVLAGEMDKDAVYDDATSKIKATTDTYTIALHMKENADASVMGRKISLNVKLVAYQMESEQDAFGNEYDQMVATAEELNEAFKQGGTIALAADINLDNTQITIPQGVTATLDLNGHTITAPESGTICAVKNEGTLTIEGNGTITGSYSALYSTGNLTVNGGTFTATAGFGLLVDNIYGTEASVAVINDGTFTGVGVYNPAVVTINGGTFNEGRDPDGACDDVTLYVSPTFVGAPNTATVILNGGTFNGDIYVYDDGITETVFTNNGATITGDVKDNS